MLRKCFTRASMPVVEIARLRSSIANKSVTALKYYNNSSTFEATTNNIFDYENVSFGNVTKYEMIRAIVVLRICSLPGFANNATEVLRVTRKLMGKTLFSKVMHWTVYGQFVSGASLDGIKKSTNKLAQTNVLPMLAVPIEDQIDDATLYGEELLEYNTEKVIACIDIADETRFPNKLCMMQLKLTAIIDFEIMKDFSQIVEDKLLSTSQLATWIANGCEKDELENILRESSLTEEQIEIFSEGMQRLLRIVEYAKTKGVTVVVDAEYTWINPAIQHINIAMMRVFNKNKPIISKTYQGYLKETRDLIQVHANECKEAGVHFAFKLVRGAYLVPEIKHAGCHPQKMCDNWQSTNENYDSCVRDILQMDTNSTQVMFATHNENSVRLAAELLKQRQGNLQACNDSNISFGQLYGMADYMSFTLSRLGFNVYKSMPFGTMDETLPYLCRRAKENTLFLTGVRKEMVMLRQGLAMKFRQSLK